MKLRRRPNMSDQPAHRPWWRQHWLILVIVAALLATGAEAAAWHILAKPKPAAGAAATLKPKPTPTPTPATVASPLTGLAQSPAAAASPIVGVMIENLDPDARPQSGLSSAGVVYEALAEGGITRFLALFQQSQLPASIGPVRSLRPYYIDWALEFGAAVAHAGGSSDALALVGPLGMKDLNALYGGPGRYFFRTTDRVAPHNLYTSGTLLGEALTAFKFNQTPTFTPSPRKADAPAKTPAAPKIHINFSGADYAVDYTYDAATNDYARDLAGVPHIDRNTGQQIHVKNVVVEYMPISYSPAPHDSEYVIMPTVGSGQAVVFRDGTAVTGTWSKASHTARTQLTDASGKAIALDAGNTWYEIVPVGNPVTY